MSKIWSVEEHVADILGSVRPLAPIELNLLEAQDCLLVDEVTVPAPLPRFDNSSMDGYAVRTADVAEAGEKFPVVLTVVGDVAAGAGEPPRVGPGQAARIMTGAPLPPGADAVVPVEWTDGGTGGGPATAMQARSSHPEGAEGQVRIHRPVEAGGHVRERGSDVTRGELALAAGTRLGPSQIGLLAALGLGSVRVLPRPRVVVLSTGSELVQPGEEPKTGQIHDANSYILTAAARAAGAIPYRVGAVADDADTLRATLEDQLVRADLVVTSGGVSVGAYDVVKEALADLSAFSTFADPDADPDDPEAVADTGGSVEFRTLAMQPGKPQGFGLIGPQRIPVLALPGNPVSAYVSFELFVRPAIRALMGLEPARREPVRARLAAAAPLSSLPGRRQFLRGAYTPPGEGEELGTVRAVGGAGSHLVAALAQADALIDLPAETVEVAPGEEVSVLRL